MTALELLKLMQGVDDINTRPLIKDIQEAVIYVSQLEARIAELAKELHYKDMYISTLETPKSCDECKFHSPEADNDYEHCTNLQSCIRWELDLPDYYEPKDIKIVEVNPWETVPSRNRIINGGMRDE